MAPPAHAATPSHTTAPAPQRPRRSPAPFKSILCAVDGSSEALHQAIALCGLETTPRLVAVRNERGTGFAAQADLSEMHARNVLEEALSIAHGALTAIEKATGSSPNVDVDPGHVAERISQAADAARSSLIVIGHRGLSGAQALGSVSERVANKAKCSVLVVPAAG